VVFDDMKMPGMNMNQGPLHSNLPMVIATGAALIAVLIWWLIRKIRS